MGRYPMIGRVWYILTGDFFHQHVYRYHGFLSEIVACSRKGKKISETKSGSFYMISYKVIISTWFHTISTNVVFIYIHISIYYKYIYIYFILSVVNFQNLNFDNINWAFSNRDVTYSPQKMRQCPWPKLRSLEEVRFSENHFLQVIVAKIKIVLSSFGVVDK